MKNSGLYHIYPLLAQQFVDDYGLEKGICLDIGAGSGQVGIEIAKITDMTVYFIDKDAEALELARQAVQKAGIKNEVHFIEADVCKGVPLAGDFADFIVSRGSIWFWQDKVKGLAEAYRLLKIGGNAVIGGGLGRYIPSSMRKRLLAQRKDKLEKHGGKRMSGKEMEQLAIESDIRSFRVVREYPQQKNGGWLEIHKHI